jgi:glycogen debranching enzyme
LADKISKSVFVGTEAVRVDEEYYLLASAFAQRRPQVLLSHGESFAIFDAAGDVPRVRWESYGLFHAGTRFLNRFELRVNGQLPLLLSTAPTHNDNALVTYLTNMDELSDGEVITQRDTVAIRRRKTLLGATLYEQLQLRNYGQTPLQLVLEISVAADFVDIFEIRGATRRRRGEMLPPLVERNRVKLGYHGLDAVLRETLLEFSIAPSSLSATAALFQVHLLPAGETLIESRITCCVGQEQRPKENFTSSLTMLCEERRAWCDDFPIITSNNEDFNTWMNRSLRDLTLLGRQGEHGSYVNAGIPWFATLFGRDSLITALETLAFTSRLAVGTLRTLARWQGAEYNDERDEEPGKILHEMRSGEMAALGEIPFGCYYGSIDATPLFLIFLTEYVERSADLALARELWPAALAAMKWIERTIGERGYLTYLRRTPRGLVNQGWKDSHDAISHTDGGLAEPPIALAEVQGYVYAAYRGMERLARRLEFFVDAATWGAQAARLQEHFNRDFWLPEEETFALALDGAGRPCRVVSSNPGHCLYTGIVAADKARQLMMRLLRDDIFCGWGVRTLSDRAKRYNPMSYHNGSVWPHDNALIAAGFSRYGGGAQAQRIFSALFEVSRATEERRLPELFCGFTREEEQRPVPYPVSCKPQAWAAGSVFLLLQATLGMRIDGWKRRATFSRATLPPWLNRVDIRDLQVGDAMVDLRITRGQWSASVEIITRQGDVEVVVYK